MGLIKEILDVNELRLNHKFVQARFAGKNALASGCKRLLVYALTPFRLFQLGRRVKAEENCRAESSDARIVFLSSTVNQTKALSGLRALYPNALYVTQNHHAPCARSFPIVGAWLVSIVALPASFAACLTYVLSRKGPGFKSRIKCVAFSLDEILLSPGYLIVMMRWLRRLRPNIIVMANDHNSLNRAACIAARKTGVISVYVQHAPVSSLFPAVLFDHMLLDGRHAAEIYEPKCRGDTRIVAIGSSRYAATRAWRGKRLPQHGVVSLSFNKLDDQRVVKGYLKALQANGWRVVLRPHPGFKDAELDQWQPELIDRRDVSVHLDEVDAVIAGDSGILLDAYMAGACPIYAKDLSGLDDYYGYIKRGAVLTCTISNIVDVLMNIDDKTESQLRVGMQHFNEAVGQSADAALIAQKSYIDQLVGPNV